MNMINLFEIEPVKVDTAMFKHVLHDPIVEEFEREFADFVGAKYACGFSSASIAISILLEKFTHASETVKIPSIIPPVVPNAIIHARRALSFYDNISWVGGKYLLHKTNWNGHPMSIFDSAQQVTRDQYGQSCFGQDVMIFSFYPTKPVGGVDGGMVVTDDEQVYKTLKSCAMYGMGYSKNSWDREIRFPGWKGYLSSIQAYAARKSLKSLDSRYARLDEIRDRYSKELELNNSLAIDTPSYHLYRIGVNDNKGFIKHMKDNGVVCGIHYHNLDDHPVYVPFQREPTGKEFILSKFAAHRTVSIPFHHKLSVEDEDYIIGLVKEWEGAS